MKQKLRQILDTALGDIQGAVSKEALENVRVRFLGKKGELTAILRGMGSLSPEERPAMGQLANEVRAKIENALDEAASNMERRAFEARIARETIDVTMPGVRMATGRKHPLNIVLDELCDIFVGMGFSIAEGPEVELDYYNFEALNIPKNHPARDMQDTFYIDVERLLRTHTTAIQMRVLEKDSPRTPIKVICPGKVYRRDDDDATHSHQFTQVEGLVVGENIRLSDLKGTLEFVARRMFGEKRVIRFRPSYFQFTEPSVEVDVSCHMCGGKGCPTCKGTGWIEILGAGMVHPNVLRMAGYDPKKVSGFAFGIGAERVAMLKYGIDDIRHFYTNDIRFLKTFTRFE